MAHFAEINFNNEVLRVVVVNNQQLIDSTGQENEQLGKDFCHKLFGGTWVKTSYNSKFRKNFAGIGYTYDSERDAFIPPKPYSSWILNEETCLWEPPVSYPENAENYIWNEEILNWQLINEVNPQS